MTDRELMQQALEALQAYGAHSSNCDHLVLLTSMPPQRKPCSCGLVANITALRERLAQQEQKTCLVANESCKHGSWCSEVYCQEHCKFVEQPAQPEQEPVDSDEKAGAYLDARLWEFIDMAAAWPEASPDPRTWDHVMVYAPKPAWRAHVEQRLRTWRQSFVNRSGDQLALDDFMDKRSLDDLIDFVCDEYTAPQPAQQPLTDEQMRECAQSMNAEPLAEGWPELIKFARAIERAHGIGEQT